MTTYQEFIAAKRIVVESVGKEVKESDVHPDLFDFQRQIVVWACHKGRCAVFADTGLGKTRIQLEWARLMGQNTLILAPLSVARQTVREGKKIDVDVRYVRSQAQMTPDHKLWITNYEMLDHFDASAFDAVVIDESSILKALDSKTRRQLTEMFVDTPFKLACTATPAPNDRSEIGNHSEFLGITKMTDMLAMFFIHANKEMYGDITARCMTASRRWDKAMGMAERNVDPAMMMLLGRLRDDIAVIERLAKDAINGEYEQNNGGLQ